MSVSSTMNDVNLNLDVQNNLDTQNNQSVFRAALPYGVGTLALGGLGTYVAVTVFKAGAAVATGLTAGQIAIAVGGVAIALIGLYGFFATAVTGIYAKNAADFKEKIGPTLTTVAFGVVTEMAATVAKTIFIKIIDEAIFGRR